MATERDEHERHGRGLVLLVEDEAVLRELLADILRDEGYRVAAARNGQEALDLLRGVRPSAIVLDLMMPVLDGFGFLEQYRRYPGPHAPVVAASANLPSETRARLAALGVTDCVPKPFDIDELLDCLDQVLARATAHREWRDDDDGPMEPYAFGESSSLS